MTLGPVRVMGAGMVVMLCAEEVMTNLYCQGILDSVKGRLNPVMDLRSRDPENIVPKIVFELPKSYRLWEAIL